VDARSCIERDRPFTQAPPEFPTDRIQLFLRAAYFSTWEELKMMRFGFLLALPLVLTSLTVAADDSKKTRVGTCNDAKSQMEYFCNPANAASDSMVAIGTACTNAKSNVKEACEGIVEPDKTYEFDDKKK
jgi:hypothetical protein